MSVGPAIASAAAQLAMISATPRLDAELLMAHALGIEREALLLNAMRHVVPAGFAALLARRLAHEPVAYILGYRDFWTIRLAVGPGVLIPRADSETLIEAAIDHFGSTGPATILDLGTGPGTLLLAALDIWPAAIGTGVERSAAARFIAQANAHSLGLDGRAHIYAGDWHDASSLPALGRFDCIFVNPPYIENDAVLDLQVALHEPAEALFAGADGLDDYRAVLPLLSGILKPGGAALIEIGASQRHSVGSLAQAAGLSTTVRQDLAGRDRVLIAHAATTSP